MNSALLHEWAMDGFDYGAYAVTVAEPKMRLPGFSDVTLAFTSKRLALNAEREAAASVKHRSRYLLPTSRTWDGGFYELCANADTGGTDGAANRVAFARAELCFPELLLVHVPTEGFDLNNAATVRAGRRQALPEAGNTLVSYCESDLVGADLRLRLPPPSRNTVLPLPYSSMGNAPFRKEAPNGA